MGKYFFKTLFNFCQTYAIIKRKFDNREMAMNKDSISRAVIKRLPRYYRYLGELMEDGIERISSNDKVVK